MLFTDSTGSCVLSAVTAGLLSELIVAAVTSGVLADVALGILAVITSGIAVAIITSGVAVAVLSTLSEVIGVTPFWFLEQLHKAAEITSDARIIVNNFIFLLPLPGLNFVVKM